jgi:hypothetical protein
MAQTTTDITATTNVGAISWGHAVYTDITNLFASIAAALTGVTAGAGMTVTTASGVATVTNNGVRSITGSTGVTVGGTANVPIINTPVATINNNGTNATSAVKIQSGTGYTGTGNGAGFTFPVAYTTAPMVITCAAYGSAGSGNYASAAPGGVTTTSFIAYASNNSVYISWIAIGV